ncbi:hypothetical protein TNCV_2086461 [Trichonephila clavipes]|nr:hypothetical protein TNCV_2086461 [Trichonephila clavipes]
MLTRICNLKVSKLASRGSYTDTILKYIAPTHVTHIDHLLKNRWTWRLFQPTSTPLSVPTGSRPLPDSTPKSPVTSNFMIIVFKSILDMGPFRRFFERRYSRRANKWLMPLK